MYWLSFVQGNINSVISQMHFILTAGVRSISCCGSPCQLFGFLQYFQWYPTSIPPSSFALWPLTSVGTLTPSFLSVGTSMYSYPILPSVLTEFKGAERVPKINSALSWSIYLPALSWRCSIRSCYSPTLRVHWPAVLQMKIFQVIPKSLYTYIPDHRHIVSVKQGWGFALSAFRSKSLILQSDCEQFAHVALYKRVNCSCRSLKKSNVCDLLVIGMFFDCFSPFYAQARIADDALCSFALF